MDLTCFSAVGYDRKPRAGSQSNFDNEKPQKYQSFHLSCLITKQPYNMAVDLLTAMAAADPDVADGELCGVCFDGWSSGKSAHPIAGRRGRNARFFVLLVVRSAP